ncbi:MAG: lipid A deacylase LpxR family protein, partial [Sphingomonadales bacterium]
FQTENDLFAGGADRHYTNGFRVSYLTEARDCTEGQRCISGILKDLTAFIPAFREGQSHRVSYSLGQNMYTPSNIETPELLADERPYAGWLYAGLGFVSGSAASDRDGPFFEGQRRLDRLELNVGVIGSLSGAEAFQKGWHGLFGFRDPKGWRNQLRNEPGVVLLYERQWLMKRRDVFMNKYDFEIAPSVGGALGNVFTYASAGARARFGSNLPGDYGPPRIRPSLPGSDYFLPGDTVSGYLFAAVEGRAVARNIFLDGNTFRNSHSVPSKTFVGDIQLGAALVIPGGILPPMRLSYTYIWRSKEYRGQEFPDRFGSINLSFNL